MADTDVDVSTEGTNAVGDEPADEPSHVTEETTVHEQAPRAAIADAATSYDVVVMGESEPSLATFVFGMAADDVAEQFLGPVVVVQRDP